ncbi:MAG: dTMP kinase [Acidilobaceae archaeon]|nr:dTMP kinase [Acidilobaceae archaeon]
MLVAFEGIDGSGLSTHARLLAERLSLEGWKVVLSKEPTSGPVGSLIRELLRGEEVDQDIMALLFAADRLWHLRRGVGGISLEEALRREYVVILDRYKHSSLAYQSLAAREEWVELVNSLAPDPHVVIYIDVPVNVALERVRRRRERFFYEEEGRLARVKENFERVLKRAEGKGVLVIRVLGVDARGERSVKEVHEEIYAKLTDALRSLPR